MSLGYQSLPTLDKWKKDSSVMNLLVRREQDSLLIAIDNIVEALQLKSDRGEALYLFCELFFATNYWLRNFKQNPQMNSGREQAIRNLFAYTANELAGAFECTINTLPNELEKYFGTKLSGHGVRQDSGANLGSRHYLNRAAVEKFKLHFKGGKAYWLPWWDTSGRGKLQLVESETAYKTTRDTKLLATDWGHFVMSMSRDLYMGPHSSFAGRALVHSSWLGGMPVQCAGSMLIEGGVVKGLRNDSGHYQPADPLMVNVLEHLKMLGVDISKIEVYDYEGNPKPDGVSGDEFLKEKGNWEAILGRMKQGLEKDSEANRMARIRRDWELLKSGKTTLYQLVEAKYEAMKIEIGLQPGEHALWTRAYKTVCLEFAEIDKSWGPKANLPPIPHKQAPHRPY